jgi:V/A-type H+/Na+-transporting ATPase subunit I
MPWRESMQPVRMSRVAVLAPEDGLREVLVAIAGRGTVEVEVATEAEVGGAGRILQQSPRGDSTATLTRSVPDLESLVRAGRFDLVAGEAELERRAAAAVTRGLVTGVLGWAPTPEIEPLRRSLAPHGAAVVSLPIPRGIDPPSLVHEEGELNRAFAPLVDTYTTVPYANVDPTVLAGLAFVLMFGMMFADAGQGALLLIGGLLLRAGRIRRLAGARRVWPFVVGAGLASIVFGVLFGEFFGPTGVLPVLWVKPLEEPILLLEVALGVGACLLGGAYVLGTVNRWREGGLRVALLSTSGVAGAAVFLGLGLLALGAYMAVDWLVTGAVVVVVAGLVMAYGGLLAATGGGAAGAAEAGVELFDGIIRLGTNFVSFARLAAFGLAHAALLGIVWQGTTALWATGGLAMLAAVALFVFGNALTFALEGVVAGVQALRLEYYELFSRVFVSEGRPFRPWSVPLSEERVL